MKIVLTGSEALYTVEQLCQTLLPTGEGTCNCQVVRRNGMVFANCHMRLNSRETHATARHALSGDAQRDVNLERRTWARAVFRAA